MSGAIRFDSADVLWLAACLVLAAAGFWFFRRLSPYFEELV
jgi:hypothetical protein